MYELIYIAFFNVMINSSSAKSSYVLMIMHFSLWRIEHELEFNGIRSSPRCHDDILENAKSANLPCMNQSGASAYEVLS